LIEYSEYVLKPANIVRSLFFTSLFYANLIDNNLVSNSIHSVNIKADLIETESIGVADLASTDPNYILQKG
jgi:hypothetical protein